ncbi:MAG: HAD family hydrolase [Spirochaetaceae bacterium]|nr:HAD family hydrolase [Spirochaetaceae bacterium]
MRPYYASLIKKYSSRLKPVPIIWEETIRENADSAKTIQPPGSWGDKPRGKNIKCLFFDLYGTLFISEAGDIASSVEKKDGSFFYKTLKICGIKEFDNNHDINKFLDLFYSAILEKHRIEKENGNATPEIDIRDIWQETLNNFGISKNIYEIEKIAVIYESLVNKTWPMPGLKNILNFISKKGIPMGIISNAQFFSEYLFEAHLKKSPLKLGFLKSLCYYSYNNKIAKPGKAMFEEALSAIKKEKKIISEEILYVGNDMLNDIKPAALSGMQTCLFAGDKRSLRLRTGREEIKNITPDYVITELCMLKDILC